MRSEGFRSNTAQFLFIHAVCYTNSVDFKLLEVTQYRSICAWITTDVGPAISYEEQSPLAVFSGLRNDFLNGLIQCKACSGATGNEV